MRLDHNSTCRNSQSFGSHHSSHIVYKSALVYMDTSWSRWVSIFGNPVWYSCAPKKMCKYNCYNIVIHSNHSYLTKKPTLFKKSALKLISVEAISTRLSRPIFGSARSATATLKISLRPYMELSIISSGGGLSLSMGGRRMDTQAMREPSLLYFVDKSKASVLRLLKGSCSPLLMES